MVDSQRQLHAHTSRRHAEHCCNLGERAWQAMLGHRWGNRGRALAESFCHRTAAGPAPWTKTYIKYVTTSCRPSSQCDSASLIMCAACITLRSSTRAAGAARAAEPWSVE